LGAACLVFASQNALRYIMRDQADTRLAGPGGEPSTASTATAPNGGPSRAMGRARGGDSRLAIRTRGRITFVAIGEIEWIETSRNYVRVRAKGVWRRRPAPRRESPLWREVGA